MSYDAEDVYVLEGNNRRRVKKKTVNGKDLGVITTTLEVAALLLSPEDNSTFTRDELIAEARSLCGEITPQDLKTVHSKHSFLKSAGNGRLCIR